MCWAKAARWTVVTRPGRRRRRASRAEMAGDRGARDQAQTATRAVQKGGSRCRKFGREGEERQSSAGM
jgi:hypothetical protein